MRALLILVLIFLLGAVFFSYRLAEVPRGITLDEAAFGYNASLISQTLRDENGRFLPVFVLSLSGRDWRQPIAQYLMALSFKLFGPSLFNLKMVSVTTAAVCTVLIFLLGKYLINLKYGLICLVVFVTTPVIMIHSHLALDNITPVPFILLWILGLVLFKQKRSLKYLILGGMSLGLSFYAHKSMRSAAPVWTVLTILYLYLPVKNIWKFDKDRLKIISVFLLSITPFYLIAPVLDYKYAGAVFGGQDLSVNSFYDYVYFYISSFDLSFLFIKGDTILHHSTGRHGMLLLSVLPIFILGIYKSMVKRQRLLIFLIVCFFTGPMLMGFVGSVHRASRLIFLVPLFCLISAYGFYEFLNFKNKIVSGLLIVYCLLFFVNFFDFINYYWFEYADDTYHIFYQPVGINAYKKLRGISKREHLAPLIDNDLLKVSGDGKVIEDFSRSLNLVKPAGWDGSTAVDKNSILLTGKSNLQGYKQIDSGVPGYYLYRSN